MFTANSTRQRARSVRISILLAALISLQGCMACRQHPVACSVAGAIVAGSVAATIENNRHDRRQPPTYNPICAPNCLVSGVR